jgi:hypothetical protein
MTTGACPFCGSTEINNSMKLSDIRPLWKGYAVFGGGLVTLVLLIVVSIFLITEGHLSGIGIDKATFEKNALFVVLIVVVAITLFVGIIIGTLATALDLSFLHRCRSCNKRWPVKFSFREFLREFFKPQRESS